MICTNSFAKNFGLYGERIGSLHFVTQNETLTKKVMTVAKFHARVIYASPPLNGSRIVAKVLNTPELREEWKECLSMVIRRMKDMRKALRDELAKINCPPPKGLDSWKHITSQIGMFCFTGLTVIQCEKLVSEYDVFLTKNGRISVSGLNTHNVE